MPSDGVTAFIVEFQTGVFNPTTGPYTYDYFQVEFYDKDGYSIDKVTYTDAFITTTCTGNCDTCSGLLSTCTSCSVSSLNDVSYYLKGTECLSDCGSGFFGDAGYVCSACDSTCTECSLAANACTLCNPSNPLPYADPTTYRCYDKCPAGTYLDEASTLCLKCESPCYTCSSAT